LFWQPPQSAFELDFSQPSSAVGALGRLQLARPS
jgi:hypothetical protein